MADRFPLILNTSVNQIQEIPSGDQLDLTGNNIANAGIVTASAFHGDGSQLTGVTSVGGNNGVDFNDDIKARFGDNNELTLFFQNAGNRGKIGTTNSTALDILTANTQRVVIENSGHVRPAINNSYDLGTAGDRWRNINGVTGNFSGSLTVGSDLTVGGVLTYEDVTNIDSVGVITARKGIVSSGVVTATKFEATGDNSYLKYLQVDSMEINSGLPRISLNDTNQENDYDIRVNNGQFQIYDQDTSDSTKERFIVESDGTVDITKGPFTVGTGVTVETNGQATFSGIITASNFAKADGSSLGGVLSDVQFNTVGGTDVATNRTVNSVNNTLFGYQAGKSIFNSDSNVAIGHRALKDLSSGGNYNVAVGEGSGHQSLNASYCAFVGNYSGSNCQGEWNVALGYQTLSGGSTQVTGDNNVALGGRALYNVSSGANNIGIGYGVGYGNNGDVQLITGSNNILIGFEAAPSNTNVSNEITLGNTGITTFRMPGIGVTFTNNGTGAQFDGAYNFARTDNSDFIQGANAQARPADGNGWNDNLILGRFAGEKLAAGSSNCLVGFRAGKEMTNGSSNTFVGYYAGIDHFGTRTGNTCIGTRAGYYSGQGDHNIIIGHQADVSSNGDSRQIILGKPASVTNFPTDFKIPALNFHLKQTTDTTTGNILTLQSDGSAKFTPFAPSIVNAVGLSTFSGGLNLGGMLSEEVNIVVGKLSDNSTIKLEDGMVHYFTVAETTSTNPTFTFSNSVNLTTKMAIGETVSITVITTPNGAGYSGGVNITGGTATTNWVGGNAPTGGGSSGVDIYSYNIIKTGSTAFTVIANLTKTS
tara:strand:- start:2192 stop:4648 length:2457 start_codon:yes stop_codon:yes gene_type:complete